ncbi:CDP-diacylglycerol--glycerol-3-phosphate 3-phosphatidyltransferase [Phycisphaera mikurensis]|uniref:CDP-diacylglycerol--glycerol-3-phosphate 3-phosphatidyltransferase n=1 Tax=Phycisphaera mikurensis (strain NBRC 102666 / KCTC 22515 / FYK2301M01) TaxID=1142394 RepID=I0IG54_PHYMF|nr:CDP-diacylglycerol--glycerol-3-phosphate 3-phosphatidyltransferase [Phycisphaera mikurensis]MBB6440375.1 CDP-diacylglycerol--glycerol-3-phosphate 3-phosphatidyltransferase [Phycisphaera mikurensis]BAM04242.1 CDP-diacylglycerol--glycerol-3-phosphate 3-phosphatidyltransferase [Phycisphaera mikurensis NBRC 102666]
MLPRRQIPNALTVLRLGLAAGFFVALNFFRFEAPGFAGRGWLLGVGLVLFVAAALTDWADGYLARKWEVTSVFGRIIDPFADKILVLGAVVYLASPRFVDPSAVAAGDLRTMVSGVYPWMVVVVLARELLVTSIRGVAEQKGVEFGAKALGKWKMVLQSVVVPVVLLIVALDPTLPGHAWMGWVRDGLVLLTVAVTVASGLPYVLGAKALARA